MDWEFRLMLSFMAVVVLLLYGALWFVWWQATAILTGFVVVVFAGSMIPRLWSSDR